MKFVICIRAKIHQNVFGDWVPSSRRAGEITALPQTTSLD